MMFCSLVLQLFYKHLNAFYSFMMTVKLRKPVSIMVFFTLRIFVCFIFSPFFHTKYNIIEENAADTKLHFIEFSCQMSNFIWKTRESSKEILQNGFLKQCAHIYKNQHFRHSMQKTKIILYTKMHVTLRNVSASC